MNKFIHGNTYYSHAHPSKELERNFVTMKDLGLNCVRVAEIWPSWSVLEPSEEEYNFSLLDDYVEKAYKNGIKVCMGIGINDTPFWLFNKYNDLRFTKYDGRKSSRRIHSACIDHVKYRNHMKAFIETIVKRYKDFDGIESWQLGNEIRCGFDYCDCEATRSRFRNWLSNKYDRDIEKLNKEWGVIYKGFEEIYPYRSQEGAPTEGIPAHYLNTMEYNSWSLEELLSWGCGIMKEYTDKPIFHNNFQQAANGNYWNLTKPCDVSVIDIYAVTYAEPAFYNGFLIDIAASIARQQNKPFWVGETCAGQYGTFKRIIADQKILENCVIEQIGAGAEAVFYFRHKSPIWEQPHKFTGAQTFLRIDESEMEYSKTPRNIASFMDKHEEIILSSKSIKPQIAVYYPEESIILGIEAGFKDETLTSAFGARMLWAGSQIPIEILDSQQMINMDLSQFKIIHLPVSYLLPSRVGLALKDFVKNGGTLISECRVGYVNEFGQLYTVQPGAGLDEIFGAKEDLFYNIESFKAKYLECNELTFSQLKQTYRLFGGTPIFYDSSGNICGVKNKYGKGSAYIFGGAPSLHFSIGAGKYDSAQQGNIIDNAVRDSFCSLFEKIAANHSVSKPIVFTGGNYNLSVRYMERNDEILLFIINYNIDIKLFLTFDDKYRHIDMLNKDKEKAAYVKMEGKILEMEALEWKVLKIKKN